MAWMMSFLILVVPALLVMGLTRLLGVKHSLFLLLAAIAGSAAGGAFITLAALAMASAFTKQDALLRGIGIGIPAGFVTGGIVLLIVALVKKYRAAKF